MAELATIARPYAEALFKAGGGATEAEQLNALAAVAADAQLRQFADNPKVPTLQVHEVLEKVSGVLLKGRIDNFVHAVLDNGRLAALPEIAAQFQALVNAKSGVSDAVIESAYPIDGSALNDVVAALEKRFKRKLKATVAVKPELIGGIRVVVGDEVLDTSVRARLEQMKTALTA